MARTFFHITDPAFAEYVYHCMMDCPQEKKNNLNPQELKIFRTPTTIRRFAETQTFDKRLLMLTRIGASFTIMVHHGNYEKVINELPGQYKEVSKREELIQAMNDNKMFVFSSRNLIEVANLAVQNSHSQVYILNYDYVKQHRYLSDIKSETYNQNIKQAQDGFDDLSTLILTSICGAKESEPICGVSEYELRALLYLYRNRDTFSNRDAIAVGIGHAVRDKGVAFVLDKLVKKEYAMRMPGSGTGKQRLMFTITPSGVEAVGKFMRYVVSRLREA